MPTNSTARDVNRIVNALEAQGWRCVLKKAGHYACYSPCGRHLVHMARTPSDPRAFANIRAEFRRRGADV